MNEDLQSEYNSRFDDHAERWASERLDARRVTLADEDDARFDLDEWIAAQMG